MTLGLGSNRVEIGEQTCEIMWSAHGEKYERRIEAVVAYYQPHLYASWLLSW